MTAFEQHAWEENIPAVYAEEVLRERGGSLSPMELRACVMLATGDRDESDRQYARRVLQLSRQREADR